MRWSLLTSKIAFECRCETSHAFANGVIKSIGSSLGRFAPSSSASALESVSDPSLPSEESNGVLAASTTTSVPGKTTFSVPGVLLLVLLCWVDLTPSFSPSPTPSAATSSLKWTFLYAFQGRTSCSYC